MLEIMYLQKKSCVDELVHMFDQLECDVSVDFHGY